MDLKKLKNKKFLISALSVIFAILASFGIEIDLDIQNMIIEIGAGFLGGGAAGYQAAKKIISKKAVDQLGKLEIEAELANDKVKAISASLEKEFGENVAMFVKGELDGVSKNIDAMAGFEWKF